MRFGRFVGAIGALNHGLQNLEEQAARRRKKEEEEEEERAARGNEKKGQAAKGKKGRKPPLNQERATVAYVRERIGRIKQTYGCARHFEITVVPRADRPDIAARVEWTKKVLPGSKADLPGVYSLETNCPGLGAAEGARLYHGLSDVEGVFRYLKSDLGLRPLYHSKGDRVDAHIYISCMAYQLVNSIMIKLKENGIPDSWRTVRERLAASSQIMAIAKHNSHLWDVVMEGLSRPVEAAEKYYKALGLDARPKTCKVRIVKPPLGSRPLSPAF
jgi:transposase